jgi:hypothetical protein
MGEVDEHYLKELAHMLRSYNSQQAKEERNTFATTYKPAGTSGSSGSNLNKLKFNQQFSQKT